MGCSVCDEIVSSYAQCAIKLFRIRSACACYNFRKSQIKIQISTTKNRNFEKPFRNLSKRTKVNFLKEKNLGYLSKKIWFRVCSVTVKMFELQNSGENRQKRSELFFENLPRACKDLISVKQKFKIISCVCTFK